MKRPPSEREGDKRRCVETSMQINVQLFGPQAALAGTRSVEVEVDSAEPTAADVLAKLNDAAPEIADSLRTSRLAVNHEFATGSTPITPGDEVALIGMVSGG